MILDLQEALDCVKDLNSPNLHDFVVYCVISCSLEKKEKERMGASKVLSALYKEKIVSEDNFKKGFMAVASELEDTTIDCPRAPAYFATFIADNVVAKHLDVSFLSTAVKPLLSTRLDLAQKLFVEVFKSVATLTDEVTASDIYRSSTLDVKALLPSDKHSNTAIIDFFESNVKLYLHFSAALLALPANSACLLGYFSHAV